MSYVDEVLRITKWNISRGNLDNTFLLLSEQPWYDEFVDFVGQVVYDVERDGIYDEAYEEGNNDGYDRGYREGCNDHAGKYDEGYEEGYADAKKEFDK